MTSCDVTADGDVEVLLRLPTPQCAPNFAFLMAADARRAVRRLPGVRAVDVRLEDHYTGDEINAALARGAGVHRARFPVRPTTTSSHALRELFTRKALVARQAEVCAAVVAAGGSAEQLVSSSVADLPDTPAARRCLELRAAARDRRGARGARRWCSQAGSA